METIQNLWRQKKDNRLIVRNSLKNKVKSINEQVHDFYKSLIVLTNPKIILRNMKIFLQK